MNRRNNKPPSSRLSITRNSFLMIAAVACFTPRADADQSPRPLARGVDQVNNAQIEADWVDRDRRFARETEAAPADRSGEGPFSLSHTIDVVERARHLADRLRLATTA